MIDNWSEEEWGLAGIACPFCQSTQTRHVSFYAGPGLTRLCECRECRVTFTTLRWADSAPTPAGTSRE